MSHKVRIVVGYGCYFVALAVMFSVLLFATAMAQAPDAGVPPPVAVPIDRNAADHALIYQEITALRAANATLTAAAAAPKPVGTQGVMASLPVLLGLLAVFVRRMKPPASMVHETWFIPVSTALAAVLSALGEAAMTGAMTWNTAVAASVGALSTWAGGSYTNPKVAPPALVEPSGGAT